MLIQYVLSMDAVLAKFSGGHTWVLKIFGLNYIILLFKYIFEFYL